MYLPATYVLLRPASTSCQPPHGRVQPHVLCRYTRCVAKPASVNEPGGERDSYESSFERDRREYQEHAQGEVQRSVVPDQMLVVGSQGRVGYLPGSGKSSKNARGRDRAQRPALSGDAARSARPMRSQLRGIGHLSWSALMRAPLLLPTYAPVVRIVWSKNSSHRSLPYL